MGEDVWKRQATPLMMSHFVQVRDFVKRWHLHQIPMGQKCCEDLIFAILVKIQDLQQIFRIVKMSVTMLYLHWVEGTPQLCPFPGVRMLKRVSTMMAMNVQMWLRHKQPFWKR